MAEKKVIQIPDMITVGDLAEELGIPVVTLVGELFKNGIMATVNQRIDFDTAEIIIEELHINAEIKHKDVNVEPEKLEIHLSDHAKPRPPIVAVMGHVDHGKTTLLDNILGTHKATKEAGGITQYISAYQTVHNGRTLTLLDTPGHEAFAALRQHGAVLTDVVVIVVAADDGVKPQTVEAIKFAREANAKIVVAINKMDKESANPTLVKTQLATDYGLNPEEWGGDTVMVEISALTGKNVDKLLDMVLLVADMEELKADYNVPAEGLVIESDVEKGRGAVVRLLVQNGTLNKGDFIVAGSAWGKVRTLEDWRGKLVKKAGPSTPATVTGFREVPPFGTFIEEVKNEREAKALAAKHYDEEMRSTADANITSSDLLHMMNRESEQQEASFVIKADVQGSLTSVLDSLKLMETKEVAVKVVASGVGAISEGDIRLAKSSGAVVYGFNVSMSNQVKQLAARNGVEVRIYRIIYELLDDAKEYMSSLLPDEVVETPLGELEVQGIFCTTNKNIIAGGKCTKGRLLPHSRARIWRGKGKKAQMLGEVELSSLRREKNNADDIVAGEMCGVELELDGAKLTLELGDRLEVFKRELQKRHL